MSLVEQNLCRIISSSSNIVKYLISVCCRPIWFRSKKMKIFLCCHTCAHVVGYFHTLIKEYCRRRRELPGICFEGNPGDDCRTQHLPPTMITVRKPHKFIYMKSNASEDRDIVYMCKLKLYTKWSIHCCSRSSAALVTCRSRSLFIVV